VAYYENRIEHLDGDLVLYQRNLATAAPNSKTHRQPKWYMKLRIGPRKFVNRSTGLTHYEEAYAFARKEFDRLRNAVALGHTLDDFTFEKHWDDWYQRNLNNHTWKADRQRWHKNQAARYYKAYFRYADGTSMRLNDILPTFAQAYWDWRIAYWSSAQGEKLADYNPKRRKAKTTTTANAVKVPSKKTLQMDQTALNQIFWDARERGRLQQVFKLKPPTDSRPHQRRPHFEPDEHQSMVAYLRSYREVIGHFKNDRVNAWHKLQRAQLYHFVIFMLNSGLRVGEAREMRWRDIQFDEHNADDGEPICVVGVRKATKTSQNRDVQTQPNANKTLKEWRLKTPYAGDNDLVWFGQHKADSPPKPFTNLNKSFQTFLSRIPVEGTKDGLLYSKEDEKRSLYSLRHTYATMRRSHGVGWEDLALNMGCKREQLEKHYDHSTSNTRRDSIVQVKRKAKAVAPVAAYAAYKDDPFLLEALKRFQAGEIDKETLLALLKPTETKS
jgi:integrase